MSSCAWQVKKNDILALIKSNQVRNKVGIPLQYRADIDGLRAIAVSIVILFHAGFNVVSGGYVGVDVFFVISGYLITSIILLDMEKGEFSLARFYERRARRILPALYFIMLVTAIFAWFWLIPRDFKSFAKSVAAVSVFLSNIQFYREVGYFDTASELKPLLHTWSLAVEEQYYAIFPLLMLLLWRLGKSLVLASLVVLGVASFAYAQWYSHDKQSAVYFLLTARGWEILLGAYLAFHINRKDYVPASLTTSQFFSLAGLALILYSAVAFDDETPFPGVYTLLPTVGAVLIILYAKKGTLTERILSCRMLVGLGLISYSAYLWHQPLFAFAKYFSLTEPPVLMMVGLSVLSFVLAYFSWKYIEKPFRGKVFCDSRCILKFGVYGMLAFFFVGLLFANKALKSRFEIDDVSFVSGIGAGNYISGSTCKDFKVLEKEATCKVYGEGANLVVIWGDSHAKVLSERVPEDGLPDNTMLMVITHDGCPPLVGVVKAGKSGASGNCFSKQTLSSYASYIKSKSPKKVILVGRWTLYLRGLHRKGILQNDAHYVALNEGQPGSELQSKEALATGITNTIKFFSNSKVYVLGQPPDLNFMNERSVFFSDKTDRKIIDRWHSTELDVFDKVQGINYINTRNYFCDLQECELRINNQPIYFDDNHLKGYGLSRIWDILRIHIK